MEKEREREGERERNGEEYLGGYCVGIICKQEYTTLSKSEETAIRCNLH